MTRDEEIKGQLLAAEALLDLARFESLCRIERSVLIEMIEFGVLEPQGTSPEGWRLPAAALRRARRAARLSRDLEVNTAGVAVILELLDERERLAARCRRLENLLGD
jgi:chaperone modulatory protein CbpM